MPTVTGSPALDIAIAIAIIVGAGGVGGILLQIAALIRKRAVGTGAEGAAGELDELRDTVTCLGTDVSDLQERVDFAERLLARHREQRPLSPGG